MEKAQENLELITRYFNDFSELQLKQFVALDGLYKDWNSKINVISRKDQDGLYEKHVLHSLSIAAAFDLKEGMTVLDLGSGGGFPGIPLAIFFPGVKFHLVDSIGKKMKVAQAVADSLGLTNVTTEQIRAEEIKNRKFDVVVSRAVAPLQELWKWSKLLLSSKLPYRVSSSVSPDDRPVPRGLICLKGGDLAQEIADSGSRPRSMEIIHLFNQPSFKEKYILYIPHN